MKAERSLGLAGCRLAAGSEVGIIQTPVAPLSSLKINCTKTNIIPCNYIFIQQITDQLTLQQRTDAMKKECKSREYTDESSRPYSLIKMMELAENNKRIHGK